MRIVSAAFILVQALLTPLPKNFICTTKYSAQLGKSPLTLTKTFDSTSQLVVEKNAFWLLGAKEDFYTMEHIKRFACEDDSIPVIVFSMHPSQGLALDAAAGHYMPEDRIGTWEEYDEKLDYYAEHLSHIPSLIVMEPSLLMHTFNSKTEYHNTPYQLAFAQRVERVIKKFPRSWVYVDAGDAMYLQWTVNLEHIISTLRQMPASIRGFTINVGSFVNNSYNELIADEIMCQTGLHYLVDTSRNGGDFSTRSLDEINECEYDPPMVNKGNTPSWMDGAKSRKVGGQIASEVFGSGAETPDDDEGNYFNKRIGRRKKRWVLDSVNTVESKYTVDDPAVGGWPGAGGSGGVKPSDYDGGYYYYGYDTIAAKACVSKEGEIGLDGYVWFKTPGESDGRLFNSGTYHPCLLNHQIECTATCPQFMPKLNGEFQRQDCSCKDE